MANQTNEWCYQELSIITIINGVDTTKQRLRLLLQSQKMCEEKNGETHSRYALSEFSKAYSDMCTLYISTNSTSQMITSIDLLLWIEMSKSIDTLLWTFLGRKSCLLLAEECGSVTLWVFLSLIFRSVVLLLKLELFIPSGFYLAFPLLIQVSLFPLIVIYASYLITLLMSPSILVSIYLFCEKDSLCWQCG